MNRIRTSLRVAFSATLVTMALGGCAMPDTGPDATAKQRENADKQLMLQDMLEKGQRN